jgi:hypothetical protein
MATSTHKIKHTTTQYEVCRLCSILIFAIGLRGIFRDDQNMPNGYQIYLNLNMELGWKGHGTKP